MRFSDGQYLKDWANDKSYPKIHDAMFNMIEKYQEGTGFIDLCGNHGMLATRIYENICENTILVDGDAGALKLGVSYSIPVMAYHLMVTPKNYGKFFMLLSRHDIDTIVARRCISELFTDSSDPMCAVFTNLCRKGGINQVFLQGRAPTKNATHPIPSIKEEMECFKADYDVVWAEGQLGYMKLRA